MDEKMKAIEQPTPEQISAMISQASPMPMAYYNYARTASSFFDTRIFLGQASVTPQGQPTFEEQLCVVMSAEFAKILRDNLSTTIAAYEERFGTLRQPPVSATAVIGATSVAPPSNGRKKRRKI